MNLLNMDGHTWVRVLVLNATFNHISYIVAVSFIDGGNRSTWRKPPTCHKSLINFITQLCIEYTSPEWDWNSQHGWAYMESNNNCDICGNLI